MDKRIVHMCLNCGKPLEVGENGANLAYEDIKAKRDKIISGSRMAKKCQRCRHKDDCHNKRLEAFNYIVPKEIEIKINPSTINVSTNNLDINELTKRIEKNLRKAYCR